MTTFTISLHFEWGHAKMLITPKLQELLRPTFGLKPLLLGAISIPKLIRFRCTVVEKWSKFSDFGQKPWTIVHGFVSGSPKNVSRKVCHSIVNEKRNLMALVSAAQHL